MHVSARHNTHYNLEQNMRTILVVMYCTRVDSFDASWQE